MKRASETEKIDDRTYHAQVHEEGEILYNAYQN